MDWLFDARSILATGSDTLGPDATVDETLQATTRTLLHGGITLENVGAELHRLRPHGDWIAVNGNRPAFDKASLQKVSLAAMSTDQEMPIRPSGTDSAPYFSALVLSS